MGNEELIADLLDIRGRLEELHGVLGELAESADVERAAEVISRIEDAVYEAALVVNGDDGVDDDGESLEGMIGQPIEDFLGVAIHATFEADGGITERLEPEIATESLSSQLLSFLGSNFEGYHLVSHQAYVYREGEDENDAYVGIEIPMGRVIIELDETCD